MDNSNIIISIIIVLCIAAGVTAYSLTNDSDNVFTNLQGITPESADDAGLGDTGLLNDAQANGNGATGTGSSGSSGGSSGGSGSGSGGSGGGGSGGGGSGGGGSSYISPTQAKNIAKGYVGQSGCYIGTPYISGGLYYCPVFDKTGAKVDCIVLNAKTGAFVERG